MRYTFFTIENYKAIDSLTFPIKQNIVPLIGINESGKTTILQAILAFDSQKDKLLEGSHLLPKNKYRNIQKPCRISAGIEITSTEEFNKIVSDAQMKTDGTLYNWFKSAFDKDHVVKIQRASDGTSPLKEYTLLDCSVEECDSASYKRLLKVLRRSFPNILYFDDFSDRIPLQIDFPENYVEDQVLHTRGSLREWQDLISEIFSRMPEEGISLVSFLGIMDQDDRRNILSDVAEVLNKEIINEWDNLVKNHAAFVGEGERNLKLSIDYNRGDDGKHIFRFIVEDKSRGSSIMRTFPVATRSKGFQWFFNFITKLKFNPKYVEQPADAIYLLDEPGSYLHSSAQEELLEKLCEIAQDNTIIFCTHSEHLLNPEKISISNIKIVDKDSGSVSLIPYAESKIIKNRGAFSALYDALHLKFGSLNFDSLKQCVIVEGIIDYYFFKMFSLTGDIPIIPGTGCDQLKDLISIAIATTEKWLVVLDNDAGGRKANERYSKYFDQTFAVNSYLYSEISGKTNVELEDNLSDSDKKRLAQISGVDDTKNGIIEIFFDEEKRTNFVSGIDAETTNRLKNLSKIIQRHFGI